MKVAVSDYRRVSGTVLLPFSMHDTRCTAKEREEEILKHDALASFALENSTNKLLTNFNCPI